MSAFHAVNATTTTTTAPTTSSSTTTTTTTTTTTLTLPPSAPSRHGDETTPTTPRPNARFFPDSRPSDDVSAEDASAKTPTRNSFGGLAAQRPLPSSPFTPPRELSSTPSRPPLATEDSHAAAHSAASQDVEMGGGDDDAGSDDESVNGDSKQASKKKKGQRFFCTEFPPCHLSFTRSEHLARHIRKHTGERPFQCHCSRRFSRLDNLRQHAQTVHVNEDIPGDSLAATGTRFQRQIRTERVPRPGNRSRANTLGSSGGHSRGHSRNLSTSSITSTASSISAAQSPDIRRRPPPLAMASDGPSRARLSLNISDSYNPPLMGSPGPAIVEYNSNNNNNDQSTGATTPTSATFSTATGSPSRYGSALQSPVSSASRPVSWSGAAPTGRRLSVPSSGNPFSGPPGQFVPSFITPLPSSTSSTFSGQSSAYASPTVSQFSEPRIESNAEADWRRRTWHPGSFVGPRPATSGLGYYQNLDSPRPTFTSQPAASQTSQATRLPGIESFDHVPPLPPLQRRQPSPMQVDAPTRPFTYHAPSDPPPTMRHGKRMSITWDTTLQKGLNNLEIAGSTPPREQWSHYQPANARPTTAPHPSYTNRQPQPIQLPAPDSKRASQEPPATPKRNKRQAWYNGPLTPQFHPQSQTQPQLQPQPPVQIQPGRVQRTSPEDSSSSEGIPTPSSSSMTEYHPAIVHSNGFIESHPSGAPVEEHKPTPPGSIMDRPHPIHGQFQQYHSHSFSGYRPQREPMTFGQPIAQPPPNDMRRLEALVAVATGERQAVGDRS